MSNVIHISTRAAEPRADSREIAAGLGTKPKSVNVLIDRYAGHFRRFGVLTFEMTKPKAAGSGGRPEKYYLLTEDQCYFLLSLSRNTDRVVDMKADLVAAFSMARQAAMFRSMTIWQELQKVQIEDADSRVRASYGSKLMLDRKRALPGLRARRASLEHAFAPDMFLLAG